MLNRISISNRQAFVAGVRHYSPTLPAMLSWGLVTGVAMSKSVLTLQQSLGMSLLVYGGTSQLAVLPLFAAHAPIWTILLTAAMVNSRFIIFSAGLASHFGYLSVWRRLSLAFFNGDIIYLLFCGRGYRPGFEPGKEAFFWGMAALSWIAWQVSSIAGMLLASLFPDNWGIELAGTLVLLPLIISAVTSRSALFAVLAASAVALVALDLPYRLALPLAVLAALLAGLAGDTLADRMVARRLGAGGADRAGDDGRGGGAGMGAGETAAKDLLP
jgi:predicted branched-subunit amino acid permease